MIRKLAWALAFLLAGTATADDQRNIGDVVHALSIDLGNVENGINRLERETSNPVAQSRFYPMEKRLVDARVYFELKNYGKAAVMFMDAIENREFKGHKDQATILFQLGFSLYKLRNYLAARQYLEECSQVSSGLIYNRALRYLIEIGLETRTGDGLKLAVARTTRVTGRSSESQYAMAKGLFRLGRTQEALTALGQIPAAAEEHRRAQYYMGVILTDRGKYKKAITAFRRAVATPATTRRNKGIVELAHMALGRLHLEQKEYTKAVDAYQEIPRNSENFHTALYEMTWAYVHSEQFDKALNALEVLLLTVEDEQLATQANILRGRLNIVLEQTDLAIETYQEIINRFSPLRQELDQFASKRQNLSAYFRWLLKRRTEQFNFGAVLSERATKWIENDEQLGEVIGLFDDMSYQRKDVGDSEGIILELQRALSSGNRVEIFPNLKSSWTRIIVAENSLISLSQRVLDAEGRLARARMSSSEEQRLDMLLERRRDLEERFARMPKTVIEYRQRKQSVHRRYADLKREAFLLDNSLKQVKTELDAMEKWLNEARYKQGKKLDPVQERKLTKLLNDEKARMVRLYTELDKLKGKIALENSSVGAGDFVSEDEATLRKRLLDAHAEEEALLNAVLQRLAGSDATAATDLKKLRTGIVGDFKRLGRLLTKINAAVDVKVADYRRQLGAERKLVKIYRRRVDNFERDSGRIAREIGVPLFKLAHRRITEVVLEADLGLVDVAWKRKTAESDKIRTLQVEQSEQMKRLQKTMQGILKD